MDTPPVSRSYLDFEGLGQLKGQARSDAQGALRQTAQQFEALFLQMTMKSMRDSVVKSDLIDTKNSDQFESLFDKEVSVQLSKRNRMGLADMIVRSLQKPQASASSVASAQAPSPSTADVLKARESQEPTGMALNPAPVGLSLLPAQKSFNDLPRPNAAMPIKAPRIDLEGGKP